MPGVLDPDVIAALVAGVPAPLNVLAMVGAPPVATLRDLGVARVTVGARIALAAYSVAVAAATEMLTDGTYGGTAAALKQADLNPLLSRIPEPI